MPTAHEQQDPPNIQISQVRPYASVIILECTANDLPIAFKKLLEELKALRCKAQAGRTARVVASGFGDTRPFFTRLFEQRDLDLHSIDVDGFVVECLRPPSWAIQDSSYTDTTHDLALVLRFGALIAIHCDGTLKDRLQKWLDKNPSPPFRRIDEAVLNAAFLRGEAKSLWLHGVHPRRSTKADSKSLGGEFLQDALRPLDDGTYAFTSARAELPEEDDLVFLKGSIGTTPGDSLVWKSGTESLEHFTLLIVELLHHIRDKLATGDVLERPFNALATRVRGLRGISAAYEISSSCPEELSRTPNWSVETIQAAGILEQATFRVIGTAAGPGFTADAGLHGTTSGRIACSVREDRGRIHLKFGLDPSHHHTDPDGLRDILWALQFEDIVSIYYESGHVIRSGSAYTSALTTTPFPNWDWRDFAGYRIDREKPDTKIPQEIHDKIAEGGEDSLFSWVVEQYATNGLLTCDDGPGEVADFIHLDDKDRLSFIHVKAANSALASRGISVVAYEVVQSQAMKNLSYARPEDLIAALGNPGVHRPACWSYGDREPDRSQLIDHLGIRNASAETRVVIVQPHLVKAAYEGGRSGLSGTVGELKVKLLDTLLHSARNTVSGVVGDLSVVASR